MILLNFLSKKAQIYTNFSALLESQIIKKQALKNVDAIFE